MEEEEENIPALLLSRVRVLFGFEIGSGSGQVRVEFELEVGKSSSIIS